MKKILAVASEGGHWVQLMRIRGAFSGCDVTYSTTNSGLAIDVPGEKFRVVMDANLTDKVRLFGMAIQVFFLVAKLRPNYIISTGAAPGYFALLWGKVFGVKTIWLDSIANSEELSAAGRKAKKIADYWLTQWPELADKNGPHYIGAVL